MLGEWHGRRRRRRKERRGIALRKEVGVRGIVVVETERVLGRWEGCCRWRFVGGSLGSLFLVDMIPKVFVIVDGLDGITMVQYPLLQINIRFQKKKEVGPSGITLAGGDNSCFSSFSSGSSCPEFFALENQSHLTQR